MKTGPVLAFCAFLTAIFPDPVHQKQWCDTYPYCPQLPSRYVGTPEITGFPSWTVAAGSLLHLECVASPSGDIYEWYKNGRRVITSPSGDTFSRARSYNSNDRILQVIVTKEMNFDYYECKARNTAGSQSSASLSSSKTLVVYFPPSGIKLSETSITVKEGVTKTITCSTTSSSNPAVSGVSVKKQLGSTEVDVTGTSWVTRGAYYGKDVSIDIKLDTNRKDNGAQYICTFKYINLGPYDPISIPTELNSEEYESLATTFKETATGNLQFSPTKITMLQESSTTAHEGQLITIVCETDSANPVANIQFHRKSTRGTWEKLTSGLTSEDRAAEYNGMIRKSTLNVTGNRLDNKAVFKCEVKEGSFQVEQTSTVNVYFPPTVKMLSNSTPVKECDTLTLTCTATDGNPTNYTYKWFYKNQEIPNEASKDYTITNIKYTKSGTYRCQAINYVPGGIVDSSLNVDILYKAIWNPELPEVFTVASKIKPPMKFVLHVIANPSSTTVNWFLPNKTAIDNNITFTAEKVNATTYTLSKLSSVRPQDYGDYTVNVTNAVGISTFTFKLKTGPPDPPCCLTLVNATAVSLTLTFTSNFDGGTPQTFTIEKRTSGGNKWDIAVKSIADPGFEMNVSRKIAGIDSDTKYEFRAKASNEDCDSDYGNILEAKTEAALNFDLTVDRKDNQVTVSWPKLFKEYTKIWIKFCPREGGSCDYHDVADPTSLKSSFPVKEGKSYNYSMIIFDGEDPVFVSTAVLAPTPSSPLPIAAIGAGIAGGFLFLLVIIAVVLATVFIHKKRRAEKGRERHPTGGDATGPTGTLQTPANADDHVYVNVDNRAFEGDGTVLAAPENDGPHQDRPGDQEERVQDLSVEDFKQWLLSKHVTESTYQILAKNELDKAVVFALLEREDIKALRIKAIGQEILVRNLVESFRSGAETKMGDGLMPRSGDAEEGAYMEIENPYEELNITPDVIADQVYAKIKPWAFSRADC